MPRVLMVVFAVLFFQPTSTTIYLPIVVNQPPPTATATAVPTATAVATLAPTATAQATATSAPTATATPIPTSTPDPVAPCPCEADTLNCGDFDTQPEAQACFDYCMATVGSDIHGLDRGNKDGNACESLPPLWHYWAFP